MPTPAEAAESSLQEPPARLPTLARRLSSPPPLHITPDIAETPADCRVALRFRLRRHMCQERAVCRRAIAAATPERSSESAALSLQAFAFRFSSFSRGSRTRPADLQSSSA